MKTTLADFFHTYHFIAKEDCQGLYIFRSLFTALAWLFPFFLIKLASTSKKAMPSAKTSLHFFDALHPFKPSLAFHIETAHPIFPANQMTVFDMEWNTELK